MRMIVIAMISGLFVGCANGFGTGFGASNASRPFDLETFEGVSSLGGGNVYVEGRLYPVWNGRKDNYVFKLAPRIGWIMCDEENASCISEFVVMGTAADVVNVPILDDPRVERRPSRRFVMGMWQLLEKSEGQLLAKCALTIRPLETCLGEFVVIDTNSGRVEFFRDDTFTEQTWSIDTKAPITMKIEAL